MINGEVPRKHGRELEHVVKFTSKKEFARKNVTPLKVWVYLTVV